MTADNIRRPNPRLQLLQKIITKPHGVGLGGIGGECESREVRGVDSFEFAFANRRGIAHGISTGLLSDTTFIGA